MPNRFSGTGATSLASCSLASAMLAGPNSGPISDGLIGAASMRTTTSSGPGAGISTSAMPSSSWPSLVMVEKTCLPVVIGNILFWFDLLDSIGLRAAWSS